MSESIATDATRAAIAAMAADLPLVDEIPPEVRQVITSSGGTATVGPKATFGTLSSGGLY